MNKFILTLLLLAKTFVMCSWPDIKIKKLQKEILLAGLATGTNDLVKKVYDLAKDSFQAGAGEVTNHLADVMVEIDKNQQLIQNNALKLAAKKKLLTRLQDGEDVKYCEFCYESNQRLLHCSGTCLATDPTYYCSSNCQIAHRSDHVLETKCRKFI